MGITSLLANISDWYAVAAKAAAEAAINFVFPDCDGYVAADALCLAHQQWNSLIDSAGKDVYRATMRYEGTNSPNGCGSNSNYTVTWSITRDRVRGSVRSFLKARNRNLMPGLRSLAVSVGLSGLILHPRRPEIVDAYSNSSSSSHRFTTVTLQPSSR